MNAVSLRRPSFLRAAEAKRIAPFVIALAAVALLMFQLDAKSLSGDEFGNVEIESGSLDHLFESMSTAWSQHPPGSHLIMHAWIGLAGTSDFTVRFPGVFWSVLSLCLLYALGRRWFGDGIGLTAMLLFAIAPDLILYGRMEKYYSLVVALALISTLLFDRALRTASLPTFIAQGLVSLVILYTDYFAALFVVGMQNVVALIAWRRDPARLRRWLLPQFVALLAFLPFASIGLAQTQSVVSGPEADLASGWLAVLGKLAYFPYVYSVGETIFPWSPTALAGVLLYLLLAWLGLRAWLRQPKTSAAGWAILFLLAPVAGAVVLTSALLKSVPLITLPNHVLFALPFFLLLVATGLHRLRRRRVPLTALAAIVVVPSIANYYAHQQFHNPVFVTPSRDVLQYVVERGRPGDALVADIASGVPYYYRTWGVAQPALVEVTDEDASALAALSPPRVWLISVGRDRTRREEPDPAAAWLAAHYRLRESVGFAEQDGTYRELKTRLTGRPAYPYRVVVQLYGRDSTVE